MSSTEYPDLPRVAVGALVVHNASLLLVKRGNAPSRGQWAIPGGSVRLGERLGQAAERETLEETSIRIRAERVVHTFDLIRRDPDNGIRYHYVIVDYVGRYISGAPVPGDDALEAQWVKVEDLARYQVNRMTLELVDRIMKQNR
jgi:ADP-ribose pyrophosphatase